MAEDYFVKSRSLEECERIADFWRAKFQISGEYVPETLSILQTCAKLLPGLDKFAIVARDVGHMGGREAYAAPKSKRIFISEPLLSALKRKEGHSRIVLGHEWAHLLYHPGDPKPRMIDGNISPEWITGERSAEDQATNFSLAFHMPAQIVQLCKSPKELSTLCQIPPNDAEVRFEQISRRFAKRKVPEAFHTLRAELSRFEKIGPQRKYLDIACEQCREQTLMPT